MLSFTVRPRDILRDVRCKSEYREETEKVEEGMFMCDDGVGRPSAVARDPGCISTF